MQILFARVRAYVQSIVHLFSFPASQWNSYPSDIGFHYEVAERYSYLYDTAHNRIPACALCTAKSAAQVRSDHTSGFRMENSPSNKYLQGTLYPSPWVSLRTVFVISVFCTSVWATGAYPLTCKSLNSAVTHGGRDMRCARHCIAHLQPKYRLLPSREDVCPVCLVDDGLYYVAKINIAGVLFATPIDEQLFRVNLPSPSLFVVIDGTVLAVCFIVSWFTTPVICGQTRSVLENQHKQCSDEWQARKG